MLSNLILCFLLFLVSCTHRDQAVSLEQMAVIGFVGFILLVFTFSLLVARARIKLIKQIYLNTKNKLHFWDKLERRKLENELVKNRLPEGWFFTLNSDKTQIEDIYYCNEVAVGRIAQDKEKLFKSLRQRLTKG